MARFFQWLKSPIRKSNTHTLPIEETQTYTSQKERREQKVLDILTDDFADTSALRSLCWHGAKQSARGEIWKILLNYAPAEKNRREKSLSDKRQQYATYVTDIYERLDASSELFIQIAKDVPRTRPEIPIFSTPKVREMLKRVLCILAIRNPASGYVQGMNELCAAFLTVFMDSDHAEADTYWCMSALMSSLHEFFTPGFPGVHRNMRMIKDLSLIHI